MPHPNPFEPRKEYNRDADMDERDRGRCRKEIEMMRKTKLTTIRSRALTGTLLIALTGGLCAAAAGAQDGADVFAEVIDVRVVNIEVVVHGKRPAGQRSQPGGFRAHRRW